MPEPSRSHHTPIHGGQIDQFQTFLTTAIQTYTDTIPTPSLQRLVYNYGSTYTEVLGLLPTAQATSQKVTDHDVLTAEVRYSLQNTMPHNLSDVIFRRTELGTVGHPGHEAIQHCAQVMSEELNWSPQRRKLEIDQVKQVFKQKGIQIPPVLSVPLSPTA